MQFTETAGIDKSSILTGLEKKVQLSFFQNIPLYFENLEGLGILSEGPGALTDIAKWYQPLFDIYEPLKKQIHEKGHEDGKKYDVIFVMGYFNITSYGRLFMQSCMKKYTA
jgi:hypothetical protein